MVLEVLNLAGDHLHSYIVELNLRVDQIHGDRPTALQDYAFLEGKRQTFDLQTFDPICIGFRQVSMLSFLNHQTCNRPDFSENSKAGNFRDILHHCRNKKFSAETC